MGKGINIHMLHSVYKLAIRNNRNLKAIEIKYGYIKLVNPFHSLIYPEAQERKFFFHILFSVTHPPISLKIVSGSYMKLQVRYLFLKS